MTREEAIGVLQHELVVCKSDQPLKYYALMMSIKALKEPERVHGRWIPTQNPNWKTYSHDQCSVCGWWNTKNALCYYGKPIKGHSLRYCPNCGAIMNEDSSVPE